MKALTCSLVVLLVTGCMVAGPGGTPSPSPTASTPPTAPPTASPSPTEDETPATPPAASLSAGDGDAVAGDLGSGCYLGACGDGPWLAAHGLESIELTGADDQLTVAIESGFSFVQWSASYAAAEDTTGDQVETLAEGGAEDGPPLTAASFDAPPSGDWVVLVHLVFANGDGDGAYFWHVIVP